jgi:hypothetical protein
MPTDLLPDDPEPGPGHEPEEPKQGINIANLILGILTGFAIVASLFMAFVGIAMQTTVIGVGGGVVAILFIALAAQQHLVRKRRGFLLGTLLVVGLSGLGFGLCLAALNGI